ncbi:hypothetical protein [Burkholderia stabilis]|uniref:hypothetical protein n=1 Tax=Burkholderia stabilis TaxID=95485 RepID=UPI0021BBCC0F|nr:hypothetical protein [Burkholderia stabilis]
MVSAMRGVGDARLTTSLAAFVVNRRDKDNIKAPAGSRARNRVSKSARFRPAAKGAASGQSIADFSGDELAIQIAAAHPIRRAASR